MIKTYTINTPEYADLLNSRHLDTLKRLSVKDGKIYYDTGVILHPIDERIEMIEERLAQTNPSKEKEVD